MKVLITGGTGFVGSHLVDKLIEKGYDVRCFIRKSSNLRWLQDPKIELVSGSFFDQNSLKNAVTDVDYIYHIAGAVMAKTPQGYFNSNHIGTKNLLEAALQNNKNLKRFVYVSSQTAAGPSYNGKPLKEDDEPHPITNYGRSKIAAEKEVMSHANDFPITIVRPSAVYGPRDEAIFIYFKTVNSGLISLIGFNEKFVNLSHSDDIVRGIILAGESDKSINQTYFLASEKWYTWKEITDTMKKFCGRKTITLKIPHAVVYSIAAISQFFGLFSKKGAVFNIEKARDFTRKYWICDISKAKNDLGFKQEVSLNDGIEGTFEWYRKNGWLK
jgi:nucleoside-diphosphate-sugar epimerase